jgi:hypothetical protein
VGLVVGIVSAQWGGCRRIVWRKVSDPAGNQLHRADKEVVTETKTNNFAMHSILLSGECERHKGGSVQVVLSGQGGLDAAIAKVEGCVLEKEWGIVASRFGVFARPTKKEKGEANHIDHGKRFDSAMLFGDIGCIVYDANRLRLDSAGDWDGL